MTIAAKRTARTVLLIAVYAAITLAPNVDKSAMNVASSFARDVCATNANTPACNAMMTMENGVPSAANVWLWNPIRLTQNVGDAVHGIVKTACALFVNYIVWNAKNRKVSIVRIAEVVPPLMVVYFVLLAMKRFAKIARWNVLLVAVLSVPMICVAIVWNTALSVVFIAKIAALAVVTATMPTNVRNAIESYAKIAFRSATSAAHIIVTIV